MCFLAFIGIGIAVALVSMMLGKLGAIVMIVLYLGIIWCGLTIQAKRWHDRDKSAWWILIGLLPVIGPIWALVENGFLRAPRATTASVRTRWPGG